MVKELEPQQTSSDPSAEPSLDETMTPEEIALLEEEAALADAEIDQGEFYTAEESVALLKSSGQS